MKNTSFGLLVLTLLPQVAFGFAVATPSPWASEAAIDVLRKGGNAVDAAIAASFALNVTQPYSMGIGGGGFFLVTKNGKTQVFNHRELAPASAHEKMFLQPNGKPIQAYPDRETGPNPVGVPGTVAGLGLVHKKLGHLPWKQLVAYSVKLARDGIPLPPKFEETMMEEWDRMQAFPATIAALTDGNGERIKTGRLFKQPDLAKTLETIGAKGPQEFYTGALAKSWLASAQKLGVKFTEDDLKNYKVEEATPIAFDVFGLKGSTMSPPSGAGLMVAGAIRFLDHYYKTHGVPEAYGPDRIIATVETLKFFQDLRNKNIGDRPFNTMDPQKFLGSAEEKTAWETITGRIHARLEKISQLKREARAEPSRAPAVLAASSDRALTLVTHRGAEHTAHLNFVDDQGMAVSYTTTIEEWFGSAMVVPGHGFFLNNELSDFTPETGHPNSAAPGKRPRSNMSPLILSQNGAPVAVLGCAGGSRIPTAIIEFMENYYIHNMEARAALAFPRFHPQLDDDKIELEAGIPESTAKLLKAAGYRAEYMKIIAVGHALMRRSSKDNWVAAAEPRWDALGISLPPRQ